VLLKRVDLEYPVNSIPRYGHGKPFHPQIADILARRRDVYTQTLQELQAKAGSFSFERNEFLALMDAFLLYGMLALLRPKRYVEVGSGQSTKYARLAIQHNRLETRLTSIDPAPRAEIDLICDDVIRSPLENIDLGIFEALQPGDIVFIDNSHRALMNSDVVVTFLDILPRLPAGVILHLHDIYLPGDYPEAWAERGYSEQYLLATYLLGGSARLLPLLPAAYITHDPELSQILIPLWERFPGLERGGVSFWAKIE
jgi:hypothetical protein